MSNQVARNAVARSCLIAAACASILLASCDSRQETRSVSQTETHASQADVEVQKSELAGSGAQAAEHDAAPWDAQHVASEALDHLSGIENPRLIAWNDGFIRDDNLRLQVVIVASGDANRVTLYHCYRHPELVNPEVRWRLYTRVGHPFVSHREFQLPLMQSEYQKFLEDTNFPINPRVQYRWILSGSDLRGIVAGD